MVILAATLLSPWTGSAAPAAATSIPPPLVAPVPGAVVTSFDPPEQRWERGHRGVDLAASLGEVVVAAAAGEVTHVGSVAGMPTVTVTHDTASRLRTTYQPVSAVVDEGDWVDQGDPIGVVALAWGLRDPHAGGHTIVHWGLLRGSDTYLDPLAWLAVPRIRLLPRAGPGVAAAAAAGAGPGMPEGTSAPVTRGGEDATATGFVRPAGGAVTSPFGMRRHPVLGTWRLHDGIDLGAGCGTPVRSVTSGTVVAVERHHAYGIRVLVAHAGGLRTGYAHLARAGVRVGETVGMGAVVGTVGSTGWSTGCHLHLMSWRQGELVDHTWLTRG